MLSPATAHTETILFTARGLAHLITTKAIPITEDEAMRILQRSVHEIVTSDVTLTDVRQ